MKSTHTAMLILCACFSATGQEAEKSGYIGLNFGTSYLLNGTANKGKIGANLNLLNFGYSFKKGFGASLKWMGSAHIVSDNYQIGYGAIMIGPMYSIPITDDLFIDLKILGGLFWTVEKIKIVAIDNSDPNLPSISGKYSARDMKGLSTGIALRHNFAKRWYWTFLAEFNSGRSTGFLLSSERINSINTNAGIGFRI